MTTSVDAHSSALSSAPTRAERYRTKPGRLLRFSTVEPEGFLIGLVTQISASGAVVAVESASSPLTIGARLRAMCEVDGMLLDCGEATVVRVLDAAAPQPQLALSFTADQAAVLRDLAPHLEADQSAREVTARQVELALDKYVNVPSSNLFAKCEKFREWTGEMHSRGIYQRVFRVTAASALSNRMAVFDSIQGCERSVIAFDSNSYLGLHDHPRVVQRVEKVLKQVGYGTPSAQLLGGTNRYLRELEDTISAFHGREDTIVFPTGYAANTGAVAALIRSKDALMRDRLAHASIQDACRSSAAGFNRVFKHNDVASLESFLQKAEDAGCQGKLVVTDGVFSMHGRIAPLPELVALTKKYGAKLMIDDAHGVGVIGATGGGIEEHFGMTGSVDVMMGTLSKAIGSLGGYITGTRDLVDYLRFYAPSGLYTTSLPAASCAGMVEALRLIREEPEHLARLTHNIRRFVPALRAAGFIVPDPLTPIVTVFLGSEQLMYEVNRELFDLGIKCSSVTYPAVPKSEAILRMALTSKHTDGDLDLTVEHLVRIVSKYGILHRSEQEIVEIGKRRFETA
ncbi:MAG TPA: aminotransferase class I/II-fold pyridoxal phosphate-dependent enzyme [Polyangiales bacterium]|nr:aminotransferase class I/II-fold pyridoxal phosphate-dependent enzyme [Polyangiales bacterium]